MTKRYALLVISTEPIDAGKLKEQKAVEHFFNEEFDLVPNGGEWIIEKTCSQEGSWRFTHRSSGTTVSVAIINWFHNICNSILYNPIRNRRGSKCDKCHDTGVIETGNNDLPCDCPAGDEALFNQAGIIGKVTGAEIKRHFLNNSPERLILGRVPMRAASLPGRKRTRRKA